MNDKNEATETATTQAPSDECLHEETERLGVIWTRCTQCGRQWADDEKKRVAAPVQSTAAGERAPSVHLVRLINGMQKGRMSASAEPEYVRGYENGYDDARRQAISVIEAGAPGEFDPEERIRTWKQGLSSPVEDAIHAALTPPAPAAATQQAERPAPAGQAAGASITTLTVLRQSNMLGGAEKKALTEAIAALAIQQAAAPQAEKGGEAS